MFSNDERGWKMMIALMWIGFASVLVFVFVGIPAFVWWAIQHVTVHP